MTITTLTIIAGCLAAVISLIAALFKLNYWKRKK
jgi:hypothetical protein